MGRLDNKTAIVIGGTSGLGEATSKKFAEEGARVAVVGMEEEKGEAIVKEIRKAKGKAIFVQMDVTDRESVQNGMNKTVEQFGTVDVLYNGAGVHDAYKNVVETDEDTFDKLMNVNVKGPYLASNAAVPERAAIPT